MFFLLSTTILLGVLSVSASADEMPASAKETNFNYDAFNLNFSKAEDLFHFGYKGTYELKNNFVWVTGLRYFNEKYRTPALNANTMLTDLGLGIKKIYPVGSWLDTYVGITGNLIYFHQDASSAFTDNKKSSRQFGYALLSGFQAGVTDRVQFFGEYRYTRSSGDPLTLKGHTIESGFKFDFSYNWGASLAVQHIRGQLHQELKSNHTGLLLALNYNY